jgi:hypothetical protein
MLVTQVNPSTTPGIFSGFGKVNVPFMLLNFNVYFDNIFIDENMQMRTGRVMVLTQGIDQWAAGAMDDSYNFNEPDHYVNGDVDSVVLDGNTLIIFIDGSPTTITYPGGEFTIEDENGDQWTIYADGTIVFHPAVPHIELTGDEKMVYRKAMRQLKDEYKTSDVNARKLEYQSKLTAVNSKITSTAGINYLNADTSNVAGIMFMEEVSGTIASSMEEINYFQQERRAYYSSKQIHSIAKTNLSTGEYDFLSNKTFVDGIPSYLYIRQNLETLGLEVIVERVKLSIIEMATKNVTENY